jgi:parallel beta-helix repeat protein
VRRIGVTDVSNVVIQGNVVSGYGYGIGMSTSCHGVEVTDNVCFDNATSGIYLSNHAHYAVGIRGNNIRNSGVTAASVNATGIYIEGAVKQARVIENHIEGVKGHGVVLANLSDSIVSDNVLSNNYDGVGTRGRGIARA